ncbi:hypothetical protein LCGC14_1096530 [marine sediment metagenome]|uniref:Uncharacterized protein n=1 Tax=marine sediment metagenome TaxID=412755 RepID=A0A0F9PTY2_9ZZZZ
MNEDEEKLKEFGEGFIKFLGTNPKINYNLHKIIKLIQSEFEFILKSL